MNDTEVSVDPAWLRGWAVADVDEVADDLESAFASAREAGSGSSGAAAFSRTARELSVLMGQDGGWGRDERYLRGRIYDFAEALLGCAGDYEESDTANAERLENWFGTAYGPNATEPSEMGESSRYHDSPPPELPDPFGGASGSGR